VLDGRWAPAHQQQDMQSVPHEQSQANVP
jgi:hypothetical protein